MNILELKENLISLQERMAEILATGEAETRELNEAETSEMAEIRSKIDEVNSQIEAIETENRKLTKTENNIEKQSKKMETRLFDLINGVVNGNLSEEQRAFVKNGNTINTRAAIQAQVKEAGQENVPEDKMGLDTAIRNASVLTEMGATWFGNAVGDVSIPRYAGSNVAWKGEIIEAADGAGAFSETLLQPKRITAYVDVSKQFLAQDSNDAEAILIKDLADAVSEKFDATVFGSEEGDDNKPAGLFYSANTEAVTALTYENVLALEEAVELKNGKNFIFITNPSAKYALKGTQMASGLQMVFDKNEIDGIKTIVSNSVDGIMAIDPRDLAVANWGGVEITVDTVSRAIYGEVRLVVNYYCDAKLRGDRVAVLGLTK